MCRRLDGVEEAFRAFLVLELAEAEHFLGGVGRLLQGNVARAQRVELVKRSDDVAVGVDDGLTIALEGRALHNVQNAMFAAAAFARASCVLKLTILR